MTIGQIAEINRIHIDYYLTFRDEYIFLAKQTESPLHFIANEIRALNDHVGRCYVSERTESEIDKEIIEARGHLVRARLDLYKSMLMFWDLTFEEAEKKAKGADLARLADGVYYKRIVRTHHHLRILHQKARDNEPLCKTEAFKHYEKAAKIIKKEYVVLTNFLSEAKKYRRKMCLCSCIAKVLAYVVPIGTAIFLKILI